MRSLETSGSVTPEVGSKYGRGTGGKVRSAALGGKMPADVYDDAWQSIHGSG